MIHELSDEEILDFLMTSEFEEEYKPEEMKYLLYKFRYFYRVLNGKYELLSSTTETNIKKLNETIADKERQLNEQLYKNAELSNFSESLKNRKLSLKERISGKIIQKKDEN